MNICHEYNLQAGEALNGSSLFKFNILEAYVHHFVRIIRDNNYKNFFQEV